jgi:deazaflavin-dependent oxidoreductase (nitroreductase family)
VDELGEQLAGWGKVAKLRTTGRASGRPVEVAIGYVEEADGSILVAAGSDQAAWARNLEMEPHCRVTISDVEWPAIAEPLEGPGLLHAVRELILKYGTPAERLGQGSAFRLRRVTEGIR